MAVVGLEKDCGRNREAVSSRMSGVLTTDHAASSLRRPRALPASGSRRCDRWAWGPTTGAPSARARTIRSRSSRSRIADMRELTSRRSCSFSARTSGASGPRPAAASPSSRRSWVFSASRRASCRSMASIRLPTKARLGHGIGCNLAQAGPADRVRPGCPHRSAPVIARPSRATLATEPVPGVVTPQPPVVAHPGGVVVDRHGRPGKGLIRADADAVPARVVDVGDAKA
jgi:hypothetical protein